LVTLGSRAFAQALPAGESVVADSGTITQAGKTLTITQSTDKLAADWQSFNVGAGHTVNFVQPSASSIALNRVLGPDVSVIQGAINANGQVFLVNPNGILFTPTAQVNVGRLVASTLNISNADFMSGNNKFEGAGLGSVTYEGAITAHGGTVALIAARIINSGIVQADRGNVLMGVGEKVTLDLGGTILLLADEKTGAVNVGGTLDASAAQDNCGVIETSAAHVKLAGGVKVTTAAANCKRARD
jgi:filamentous hemagglutinin family protein